MKNLCIILVSIGFALSAEYASSHTPIDRDWYGFISSMYYDQGNGNITPGDDQVDRKRRHKRRRKMRPSKKGLDR